MGNLQVVLNWHDEREKFRRFLSSSHKVLHVVGNDETYAGNFHIVARETTMETHGSDALCLVVDPLNMTTSTPYGVLKALAVALGLDASPHDGSGGATATVASNITARRDVEISNIHIVNNHSYSEAEEFEALKTNVLAHLRGSARLSRAVLVVQQCHEIKMRARRLFLSSLWTPVLEPLCHEGLKVAFIFCPDRLKMVDGAIPSSADTLILLPSAINGSVVETEVAQLIVGNGWEPTDFEARAAARTTLALSKSARDVYQNLALLAIAAGGAS